MKIGKHEQVSIIHHPACCYLIEQKIQNFKALTCLSTSKVAKLTDLFDLVSFALLATCWMVYIRHLFVFAFL